MTAAGWAALAITIFGSFCYAAGSILQAVGARRSTGTVRTLGHPLYLIGVVCDLLAWAGSMIALRELAVYLVESVLAGSLAITVVAARLILKSRLRKRDVAAIVVSVTALTVLAMSAGPQESVAASSGLRFWFCTTAVAAALIGWGTAKVGSPGVVAALAGLSLGAAALAGRALSLPPEAMHDLPGAALAIVTEPLTAALVIFAATGMLLYTHALQHGQVGPVTAVLWIGEVIAPSAVALLLLGDTVRPGWELAAAVAGLVTVGAAVLLAGAPATSATARPPDALPARAPRPALPAADQHAERIIWWGAPPIWRPPNRSVTRQTQAALTRDPPHRAVPRSADDPAAAAVAHWVADQPARVRPVEREPSLSQPSPVAHSGTFLWSGPLPNRTHPA